MFIAKAIVWVGTDKHENVVSSPSIIGFTSMKLHKAFAFVSRKGQNKKGINHVPPNSLPHLCQSFVVEKYANDDGLGEGLENLLEEGDAHLTI